MQLFCFPPPSQLFDYSGGAGTVTVTTAAFCTWNVISNSPWVTLTSNSTGTGNGTVNYSVSANSASSSRSGTMTIVGKTFTVSQSGGPCTYSISPSSQFIGSSGGTGSISVTAPSGCSWSASTGSGWITVVSGSSGNGNGTVGYWVSANSGTSSRSGIITMGGQTFTLSQSGVFQYALTVNKVGTGSGTIGTSPSGTIFNQGTVVTLTATADASAAFAGWSGGYTGVPSTCTLTMNSDNSVTGTFNLKAFTTNASAGANGSISPAGTVTVNYGASQAFTITPDSRYRISDVQVDGVSIGGVASYLFGNIMANHTIIASFSAAPAPPPTPFILAISAGGTDYVGSGGIRYQSDRYSTGGATRRIDTLIQGTADSSVYSLDRI